MVKPTTTRSRKFNDLLQFGVVVVVLIILNLIAAQFTARLDLTEDKRYSISPATKKILGELKDVVYIEVYLEGDFPAGFRRLQKSTREMLEEFRRYAGNNLEYRFVDPSASADVNTRNQFYQQLAKKGIQPTNLFDTQGDKKVERIIFPGALVSYLDKEQPVLLLRGNSMLPPDQRLNQSVEGLEYELASAIRKVGLTNKKKIGILEGHGELSRIELAGLTSSLEEYYTVERVRIQSKVNFDGYDALIMAKPNKPFSDTSKFKLDQFIINGGKVLFCVDALSASLDSIGEKGTVAMPNDHNLDDLLFKYGVRLNQDFVQDVYSAQIPMVTGYVGDQLQTNLVPWRYFPILNSFGKHPISKNMDMVYMRFAGTIDSVKATGIKKTPLMYTSKYARILPAPVRLNFNEARLEINPEAFNKGPLPMGYVLEGKFKSLYSNRLAQKTIETLGFKEENKESRLVVIPDGDFLRNEVDKKANKPLDLGFDRFMRTKFANKDLALNAIDYMLDESGLLSVRAKEITMRPLDRLRVQKEKNMWQALNLVVPVLLVLLYGVVRYFMRKRKYTRFN